MRPWTPACAGETDSYAAGTEINLQGSVLASPFYSFRTNPASAGLAGGVTPFDLNTLERRRAMKNG